ncbi:MAG: NADH-quinone oxidoreductase subunit N [Candidatus Micrarchaeaceae archaeon]|jgi:proton-translocating NADH-quinone oxidoreductase chain N
MFEIIFTYLILLSAAGLVLSSIVATFTRKNRGQFVTSLMFLLITLISSTYLLATNYNITILGVFHIYPFSSLFIMLFSVALILVNTLSYAYSSDYSNLSLLLAFTFMGTIIVASATSIIEIFIGLELMAIATSFMILFEGKHRTEAAIKFFILSSLSIAVFSFALVLIFPFNAQLTLTPIAQNPNISGIYLIIFSMALFAAAFGFDAALFPFNLWIPDVYQGAPTYVTSMLAGINKKIAFVALMEVFLFVFIAYQSTFSMIFVVLAILTMFFGNLLALVQKNIKRMFAYSSIAQAGYILIGIAVTTQYGIEASIFYIIAHSFMIIGAFAIVLWLESKNIRTVDDYAALNSRNSFAAISLTLIMLSMAGIPPLIGFAGKFLLFSSALSANMLLLAILAIINSFISIYYYGRVINVMYLSKEQKKLRIDPYIAAVVVIVLAVIIIFGIYPQPLINVASIASKSILGI